MNRPDDDTFVSELQAELGRQYDARRDLRIAVAARRRFDRSHGLVALAALVLGAIAASVVWWLGARHEEAAAFGERVQVGQAELVRTDDGGLVEIRRGPEGAYDGERVIFRGALVGRIEHWRAGKQHGVALYFDARGRVVRMSTWEQGVERGPWIEYDEHGRERASGVQ